MWRVYIERRTMFETMLELMRGQLLNQTVHNVMLLLGHTTPRQP